MKTLIIDDDPDIAESVALCFEIRWPGCEVMTLPALIFGKRTNLACAIFTPIDEIENKLFNE